MIKLIKKFEVRALGSNSDVTLPLVPGTGALMTETSETESGRQVKKSLTARLYLKKMSGQATELLKDDVTVRLTFEDGTSETIGTDDIPVILRLTEENTLLVSLEYISGLR